MWIKGLRLGRLGNYFWIGKLGWEIHKSYTNWVGFGVASTEFYGGTEWIFKADRILGRVFWARK